MGKAKPWLRFSVFYIYKISILEVTISRVPSPGAYTQNVKENGRMTSGNKTQSRSCPHIHKTRNSKKEEFKLY